MGSLGCEIPPTHTRGRLRCARVPTDTKFSSCTDAEAGARIKDFVCVDASRSTIKIKPLGDLSEMIARNSAALTMRLSAWLGASGDGSGRKIGFAYRPEFVAI